MRILHVIATLAPNSGGPTNVIKSLATSQADAGHDVTVCTTDRSNPAEERLPQEYFDEFYSGSVRLKVFPVVLSALLISPALANWLKANIKEYDVVHIHGLYRFPPSYAAYQARRQNVPYIIRPHGNLDPYLYKTSSRSVLLKRFYERLFDIPNLNSANALHYTAQEEYERASYLRLQAPHFVVPNGLDLEAYRHLSPRGALRQRLGLADKPVILFLGRLHFKKGLDLLVPAFDSVQREMPDAQLVIVGPENDDYGSKVRGWVKERGLTQSVHFVGPLQGGDVLQAYVDADLFVLPSYTENFGMTVIEAMACALPVVISDQVNIHRDVTLAGAGLVTSCHSEEVAQAMTRLLHDTSQRESMGEAGRLLVQKRYAWPAIVEKLTQEYMTVIDNRFEPAIS